METETRDIGPLIGWVAEILACPVDELTEESSILTHPKWDSFAQVEIMLYMEKRFATVINERTINEFSVLSNIIRTCRAADRS